MGLTAAARDAVLPRGAAPVAAAVRTHLTPPPPLPPRPLPLLLPLLPPCPLCHCGVPGAALPRLLAPPGLWLLRAAGDHRLPAAVGVAGSLQPLRLPLS